MMFNMYAVREKGTNKFMPYVYIGKTIRDPEAGSSPAMFIAPGEAQKSINMWAQGERRWDPMGTFVYDYVPDREPALLEIVEVTCIIPDPPKR